MRFLKSKLFFSTFTHLASSSQRPLWHSLVVQVNAHKNTFIHPFCSLPCAGPPSQCDSFPSTSSPVPSAWEPSQAHHQSPGSPADRGAGTQHHGEKSPEAWVWEAEERPCHCWFWGEISNALTRCAESQASDVPGESSPSYCTLGRKTFLVKADSIFQAFLETKLKRPRLR